MRGGSKHGNNPFNYRISYHLTSVIDNILLKCMEEEEKREKKRKERLYYCHIQN